MVTGYATALVVTLVTETVVYAVGLPRVRPVDRRTAAAASVVVNLVSHPVAWFVLWPAVSVLAVVEALVVMGEWAALARWRKELDRPLMLALVLLANGLSLGLGALVP